MSSSLASIRERKVEKNCEGEGIQGEEKYKETQITNNFIFENEKY